MDVGFDGSELNDLAGMLARAAARPRAERAAALDKTVHRVAAEARANAASFHKKSTGALAASIETDGTQTSRRVYSNLREAFFLEFGSPNTGGPQPWLSQPAEAGAGELLKDLGKIGEIW